MTFDLRIPVGLMFSTFGLILVVLGWRATPAMLQPSLGLNINLWWGGFLLCFGAATLAFAARARRRR